MSEHPEHQSKQERMREALEEAKRWMLDEHKFPPHVLIEQIDAALSDVTEQKDLGDGPEPLGQSERGTNINPSCAS